MMTAKTWRNSCRSSMRCNRSACARSGRDHAAIAAQSAWPVWSRHKKPGFSTRVAPHVSGREVRVALMNFPLYEFETVYSGLTSSASSFAGLGAASLQSLMGFFLQLQGQFGTFLYTDPDDNGRRAGICHRRRRHHGVYDGAIARRFSRAGRLGDDALQRLFERRAQSSGFTLTAPNTLSFGTAPASGSPFRPTFRTLSIAASSTTRWISRSSCRTSGSSTA